MGMDLEPVNPSEDAPRDERGEVRWGRYNWSGWRYLNDFLEKHNCPTTGFSGCNDGELIDDTTCKSVADCIEKNAPSLPEEDRNWLLSHVPLWRTCGGYRQY